MSFQEILQKRRNPKEIVYEAYGKIDQNFKLHEKILKEKNEVDENSAKKLPFFMNKAAQNEKKYDFLMNVNERDEDVEFVAKAMSPYLNVNEAIRIRMALLYCTEQYTLFRNYLIAMKEILKGVLAIKVTRKGKIKKKILKFNRGHICIMANWSRKILLYDDITQINIGSSCTPELRLFEKRYKDTSNRPNYVVLRTLYRDYSFLFITDESILVKVKNESPFVKLKNLLKNPNVLVQNEHLHLNNFHMREVKDNTISTTEEICEDIRRKQQEENYEAEERRNSNMLAKDKLNDMNNISQGFKYYFFTVLRSTKLRNVDMYSEEIKAIIKKNNMIFFDKYDFKNTKINCFFLFCQLQFDICGPEIWFTSKFDEILFTHMN
ncbi:conserved Plasmodium protein, unknown function [Plasmodium knowlesi strain H]|uniref:Uncharacterized protein n=3 Tax=Plasmodium knowlesi TaxID=5850 RepID=A0A5K1U045_PLAKH|nr:conserved Plasmodium protein, unknown function [Plasmodium knowlesi strain H]OTN66209.1 Uncharacterized protein PKNOH_S09546600 [Plasmodium knowlesi]CAA9989848.1 conserved Plasmodium protein, unknown function [Plasmodium knowlesi strain H]SBO24401.1 conserved Plasmodium protein, unknown function [Plasmodium knowlesi strain H]SBO26611.1 conserved Plasmodium protein, unknown function [Plasmodium knowlesi strain H]VVS79322.1 conserved Plasmodium protein, unknown function [Plasmodium knowlesi s|eukprot:XP_002259863.1 hypothetical protein, conserved in Plasmodium species [Plasmodium knowlesi strain H]